jgi:hypothetical protein
MARSTTPRSGTRRNSTATAKKAPAKRAAKAEAPETAETPPETVAAAPVKRRGPGRPKAAKTETVAAEAVPTPPLAPAVKRRGPGRPKAVEVPKTSAKTKAAAKPKARAKAPPVTTRTAKARAAVSGAAGAVSRKLPQVKGPEIAIPEVTAKRVGIGAGLLAAVGAAAFLWRSSQADQPDYKVVEQDGDFEIREYPATTTAATTSRGPRRDAMQRNFRTLADYIFAKSRPGEKLSMTTPVTTTGSIKDGWTMRFLMPAGKARADLPAAPQGVTLETLPPRRAAAVRFSGAWTDALLDAKEGALRTWLESKNYPHEAKAEHAAYNSPMMPGPLRRNELLVTLSEG